MKISPDALQAARNAFDELNEFRAQRHRLINFAFGRQWDDPAPECSNNDMSEAKASIAQGRRPVTVNLLRRLVRTLVGRFRSSADGYSSAPLSTDALNSLPELDARLFEEYIISGCAIQRIVAERRPGGKNVWIDNVDPDRFFVNRFRDPRGHDINLVGMVHEFSWPEFLNRFGYNSDSRKRRLKAVFDANRGKNTAFEANVFSSLIDFDDSCGCKKICVVEMWSLEPVGNTAGKASCHMEWRVRFIAPDASVVHESLSPLPHKGHPFVVKFYPLIDGKIHPFLEDLVDRQKAINRLLTTFEAAMATAAKGALLFPQDQLVRSMDYDIIGDLWARPNSVIPIVGRGNDMPQQMYSNVNATGMIPLIEMQLKLLEESSGLTDAIKGRLLSSPAGAEAFKALLNNAEAGIADLLESFRAFIADRNSRLAAFPQYSRS